MSLTFVGLSLLLSLPAPLSYGQARVKESESTKRSIAEQEKPDNRLPPNEALGRLELLVGPWRVQETHVNPRGEAVATVDGTEEINWVLDKHAIQRVYQSASDAMRYQAIGLLTYDVGEKRYRGVWFDNLAVNGPAEVTGLWSPETKTFVFELTTTDADGAKKRYRRIEEWGDENHRLATTFLLSGSEVTKLLEVKYERTIPCPDKVRAMPFFDEVIRGR